MKRTGHIVSIGLALAGLAAIGGGCAKVAGAGDGAGGRGEGITAPPWQYIEGRGVKVAASAMTALGLELSDVSFGEGPESEDLLIPSSALLRSARGNFVYVQNGDHFFRSPVEVGGADGELLKIADGLFEGDVVVSAGVQDLWLIELQAINGGASCADSH